MVVKNKSKKHKKHNKRQIKKRQQRSKKIKKRNPIKKNAMCSPLSKSRSNNTCFSRDALIRIADYWNGNHSNKIKISKNTNNLWKNINKKFDKYCDKETCWVEQDFFDKKTKKNLKDNFKPKMPTTWGKKPREWLTTVDIRNVMRQYDDKHDDFMFIGPVPIDFDHKYDMGTCIVNELCNINVNELLKNKVTRLGVIFNTDPHNKSGEHWISLFADLNKGVYFFDSYGLKPPTEIDTLMKRLQSQCKALNIDIEMEYNDIQHQFKNSECGVYSMNFIIQFLNGRKFLDIINDIIPDDDMQKNRYVFYRK